MKRNIMKRLVEWQNKANRKPLLIRGARQVGKTYSIVEFGKTHFKGNVHILNFEKNPDIHSIFNQNLDSVRILSELELILNKHIKSGIDLLFFDEIQECPKAIMALRYFYEQIPSLHVIAAGSLLEFAIEDISFPVGRLQMLYMQPMTFEEFLIANNKELLAEKIKQPNIRLSASVLEIVNDELYTYFIIGGMPECVKIYVETGSLLDSINIQTDLIATFRQDFSKYAGHSDKRCLNSVLSSVASRIGEQIKYSQLAENYSNPTIKKAFELLETARLFTKVRAVSPGGIPLGANASDKKFKVVFLDIGMLSNLSGFYSDKTVSKQKLIASFRGKMAEQFVGQELRASVHEDLYYWSRDVPGSSAETDYFIEKEGEIIPIEVKSGRSGSLKSLHILLDTFTNIKTAFVFTEDKYGELPEQKIKFLPMFYASWLGLKQKI
ncbi:MAG: ATP-binding protein [Cyclobacteriaceae bacterium]|nr:ATP-binding protein [Cyclobacteriaceae bacterium]